MHGLCGSLLDDCMHVLGTPSDHISVLGARSSSFISGSSSDGWAGSVCEHFSCRIKKIKNTIFYFLLILELLIADRRITMSLQTKLKRLIEKSDFLSEYQLKNLIERHF